MKKEDLGKYWKRAIKGRPAEARVIEPASVVTAPWVRLKCQYGCQMYGKRILLSTRDADPGTYPGDSFLLP